MRLRNQALRTGNLLTYFEPVERIRNRSLLFLVSGTADIQPLTDIETVCRDHIERSTLEGFEWNPLSDQGQLAEVDPLLDASRLTRLEVAELAGLSPAELKSLLGPALDRLAGGEAELFPAAGGAVGAPAEGIQFLGRETELADLARRIRGGENLLLLAPRRSGKTSLLRRLEKDLAGDGAPVYVNLERDLSPADTAARCWVLATGERYRPAQRHVEEQGWEQVLTDSLRFLTGSRSLPLVILLDELVFFFQNLRKGTDEDRHQKAVLAFLETLAEALSGAGARLVVAGSLDFLEYLRESVGLDLQRVPLLFRGLRPYPLPPLALSFPSLEMRRVLLGTGIVPEPGDLDWLIDNVDLGVPYPALRFLDQLASRLRAEGRISRQDMEALLDQFLGETEAFDEFEEHLARKGASVPGARRAASEALDLIAERPAEEGVLERWLKERLERGVPGQEDRLFHWLLETFPLRRQEGDRVVFASRLFRRWWRRQLAETGAQR